MSGMPWAFRRGGEARRIKSGKRGYRADLQELRERFEADTVANADQLGRNRNDPDLVVLLAASAGAAVALGGYGVAIRARFKDTSELTTPGPPDPVLLLARVLDDPQAIMDAFRVLVWGYASEVVAWQWPDRWAEVCEQLTEVMSVASDAEAKILAFPPTEPDLSVHELARRHADYRAWLLAAIAEAASGEKIQSDDPWIKVALPGWNDFYTEGEETVAELMQDINAQSVDIPATEETVAGSGPDALAVRSKQELAKASERLAEHITDVPFDPEFRSVLRASAAVGYGALQRFEADRFEPDVQPGPQTRALLEAWRSPAAADRAVRTAAWLVFGAAIGLLLGIDRRQEAVDAASVAIPLSPLDLSWVLDHVDDCFRWMQESDVEVQVALMTAGETPDINTMMGEWGAPVTLNSWMWLCDAVLQSEPSPEPPPLDDDTITWGIELAVAMFDDLTDVWARLEDARGAG